ncbi:MAG: type II toxin-antitoxin system RelE/ParE family toxin, partial [Bacteroidota bacterium]
ESFQNKELRKFYEKGVRSGLNQSHIARIRRILTQLEAAHELKDLEEPAFGLHPLHGNLKGFWAKEVSGNWRIIFRFENGKAYDIDYLDYH